MLIWDKIKASLFFAPVLKWLSIFYRPAKALVMKKLLVIFNGVQYSNSLSQFALEIAKRSQSHIHAVFTSSTLTPALPHAFPNDLIVAAGEIEASEELEKLSS